MSEFKKIYIDIYHGIFNEEILVYEDFIHLYELDIITQESVDSIVEQVKSLIFEHYNDGLYIRSEEFEDICYLNIILLFGEEYEFLLPYLEGINTDIPKDAIPEKQKNKEHDTFLWVSYTDQDEIIKTQEKLSELDIGSEVYYVESNSFERGAGDFHKNFLIGLITDYFALPSPPISNSSPPIRQSSPPLFLNQIRPLRQPIRASSPLNSLFCV